MDGSGMNKLVSIALVTAAFVLPSCSGDSSASRFALAPPVPQVRPSLKLTNLYAATSYGTDIFVFSGGTKKLLSTIHDGVYNPQAIAFDASGDLFATNDPPASQGAENVAEYSGG